MKKLLYIGLVPLSLVIGGCETLLALPNSFNTKNIMEIKVHTSSESIVETFGNPTNVRSAICGKEEEKWNCSTWEYGEIGYGYASFTFYHKDDKLFLNNYNIDRDW